MPEGSHRGINTWIIYLAVPAVALKYIPSVHWSNELLLPAAMPLIVWSGSWLTFFLYAKIKPIDTATRAALTLTAGLGNTSFIGFPLVQGYYGDHALPIAVICDQSSFMIMSTLGAAMAMQASASGTAGASAFLKKLLLFPPFIAFLAAIILPRFVDLSSIDPLFDKIALTLVPMALFSVGMQLSIDGWLENITSLSIALSYKLVIAPAFFLILILALHLKGMIPTISLFEAAMAPMITAGVLAAQYQLNPKLANLVVGVGILVSFITTAIWWLVTGLILI